jgi:opacity protein-like surface antigen
MQKLTSFLRLALASTSLVALPAFAADALISSPTVAEPTAPKPITITIDNYATFGDPEAIASAHEIDILVETTSGDWTYGLEAWFGIGRDYTGEVTSYGTPEFTLFAGTEGFGRVDIFDITSAAGDKAVTPTAGTTHFGTEDILTFGTASGYTGQGILYTSPSYAGFSAAFSYATDIKGTLSTGDVSDVVSAALIYGGELPSGNAVNASLGIDAVTALKNGNPAGVTLPISVQAGVDVDVDGFVIGAAGQYQFHSLTGGESWAIGAGVSKEVIENVTLLAEVATNGFNDTGVAYRETGVGIGAEYAINEFASVDAAYNFVRRTGDDGSSVDASQIGVGVSFKF